MTRQLPASRPSGWHYRFMRSRVVAPVVVLAMAALLGNTLGRTPVVAAAPIAVAPVGPTAATTVIHPYVDSATQWGMGVADTDPATCCDQRPGTYVRLWDSGTTWAQLEPTRGGYDFARLDGFVDAAQSHGVKVILTLGMTPAWERSDVPVNYTTGAPAAPIESQDYSDYVRTVVARYAGRISAYEPWNEPDMRWRPTDAPGTVSFWSGGAEDLAELSRIVWDARNDLDPTATVLSPAFGRHGTTVFGQWLDAGGAHWSDAISYHPYGYDYDPQSLHAITADFRAVLAAHAIDEPLWATEVGWDTEAPDVPRPVGDIGYWSRLVSDTLDVLAADGTAVVVWYATSRFVNARQVPAPFTAVLH